MVNRKPTLFDNPDPSLYKYLFPGDFFGCEKKKDGPMSDLTKEIIAATQTPIDGGSNDFYMEHALTLDENFDNTFRDRYGNYEDKTSWWYRQMEANGFPFGEDRMPWIWEDEEYYD